jgi:Zn-dependent metalloprotease
MRAIKRLLTLIPVVLFAFAVITHAEDAGKQKGSEGEPDKRELARLEVLRCFGQNFTINDNGIPTRLEGHLSDGITATDPVEMAYQFFELHKDLFQLDNPKKELLLKSCNTDKCVGNTHVSLDQVVNDIKVRYGGYALHFKSNGSLYYLNGAIDPEARKVDTTPSISAEQAKQIAASNPDYEYNNPYFNDVELLIAHFEDGYHLVWRFFLGEITADFRDQGGLVQTKYDFFYIIDAKTGDILKLEPGAIF